LKSHSPIFCFRNSLWYKELQISQFQDLNKVYPYFISWFFSGLFAHTNHTLTGHNQFNIWSLIRQGKQTHSLLTKNFSLCLLLCCISKNSRIVDGVLQDIGHNAGVTFAHCSVAFQNVRSDANRYRLLLLAPVAFSRQVREFF